MGFDVGEISVKTEVGLLPGFKLEPVAATLDAAAFYLRLP